MPAKWVDNRIKVEEGNGRTGKTLGKETGRLPAGILHLIFEFYLAEVSVETLLRSTWKDDPAQTEALVKMTQRTMLVPLRSVSHSWKHAVDTSPFWNRFLAIFRLPHHDTHSNVPSSGRSSSLPNVFCQARDVFWTRCIPAVMEDPKSDCAGRRHLKYVRSLGRLPWCEDHDDMSCQGCLRTENDLLSDSGEGITALRMSLRYDTDHHGFLRLTGSLICDECRKLSFQFQYQRLLKLHSHNSGIIRGLKSNFVDYDQYNEYVDEGGEMTASESAERCIEEGWLFSQTDYYDLIRIVKELQKDELRLKYVYITGNEWETRDEKLKRWKLSRILDPWARVDEERDEKDMMQKAREWNWEAQNRGTEVLAALEENLEAGNLLPDFYDQLHTACYHTFIRNRIRLGFWISPITEVKEISGMPNVMNHQTDHPHPYPVIDYHLYASTLSHPFPTHDIGVDPELDGLQEHSGLFSIYPGLKHPNAVDPILPSPAQVKELQRMFQIYMRRTLRPVMQRIMHDIRESVGGDDDAAEIICEGMGLRELLEAIRGESVWRRKKSVVNKSNRRADFQAQTSPKRNARNSGNQAKVTETEDPSRRSPVVEVIVETQSPDYQIKDITHEDIIPVGSMMTVPNDNSSSPPTTNRKRKDPPVEMDLTTGREKDSPPTTRQAVESEGDNMGKDLVTQTPVNTATRRSSEETGTTISTTDDALMPVTPDSPAISMLDSELLKLAGHGDAAVTKKMEILSAIRSLQEDDMTESRTNHNLEVELSDEEDEFIEDDEDNTSTTGERAGSEEIGRDSEGHYAIPDESSSSELTEEEEGQEEEEDEQEDDEEAILPDEWDLEESEKGSIIFKQTNDSDLVLPFKFIPFVPLPQSDDSEDPVNKLIAKDIIMDIWRDVRTPLRSCRCTVCERARTVEEVMRAAFWVT